MCVCVCLCVCVLVCVCVCVCVNWGGIWYEPLWVLCEQRCLHAVSSACGLALPVSPNRVEGGGGTGLDQGYQTGLTIPMLSPLGPDLLRPRAEGNELQMTQVLEATATRGT